MDKVLHTGTAGGGGGDGATSQCEPVHPSAHAHGSNGCD